MQVHSSTVKKGRKTIFSRKKCRNQFLLVLMRLKLLTLDLADQFQVSEGTMSSTFATEVRFLGQLLHDLLVVWLPNKTILSHLSSMCHSCDQNRRIIDCTEILIKRPNSLDAQATTWSYYKKHIIVKGLAGISPTGYILFVSDFYCGCVIII